MASVHNSYDITLNKELLVDPTFEKVRKFTEFFPIKFETINSRKFERLTNSSQILLLTLVSISYRYLSVNITVNDSQLPRFRRLNVVELFSELNDFGYLQCPNIKEYIENQIKEKKEKAPRKKTAKIVPSGTPENLSDLPGKKTHHLISVYCQLFKARWNSNPEIGDKGAGIAKRIAKDLTIEKITTYTEAFFKMPDQELLKKKHPLYLFEVKLNEVTVFANSGNFTTGKQAQQYDHAATVQSQIDRIKAGTL